MGNASLDMSTSEEGVDLLKKRREEMKLRKKKPIPLLEFYLVYDEPKNVSLLPLKVLTSIFEFLVVRDHLSFSMVSKRVFSVGNSDHFWRKICLGKSGILEEGIMLKKMKKIKSDWQTKGEDYYSNYFDRIERSPISFNYDFKVSLVGGKGSGKTSLCRCIQGLDFNEDLEPSVVGVGLFSTNWSGLSFYFHDIRLNDDGTEIPPFQFYVCQSDVVVLCFSIVDRESYEFVENIIPRIEKLLSSKGVRCILVGTKCDLEKERKVGEFEGWRIVVENKIVVRYIECSRMKGISMTTLIGSICEESLIRFEEKEQSQEELS